MNQKRFQRSTLSRYIYGKEKEKRCPDEETKRGAILRGRVTLGRIAHIQFLHGDLFNDVALHFSTAGLGWAGHLLRTRNFEVKFYLM